MQKSRVAGALLRDRMRDLVRNNPHAAKAVSVLVNNIVGAGIMPRAATGDDKLDREADALWEAWSAQCDADGQLDCYGLQTLTCREMVEAGEVLLRRRPRRSERRSRCSACSCRSSRPTCWMPPAPAISPTAGALCRGSSSTRSAGAVPTGCYAAASGR